MGPGCCACAWIETRSGPASRHTKNNKPNLALTHRYREQNASITAGAFQTTLQPNNLLAESLLWNNIRAGGPVWPLYQCHYGYFSAVYSLSVEEPKAGTSISSQRALRPDNIWFLTRHSSTESRSPYDVCSVSSAAEAKGPIPRLHHNVRGIALL